LKLSSVIIAIFRFRLSVVSLHSHTLIIMNPK
jgi:hypothetical protein